VPARYLRTSLCAAAAALLVAQEPRVVLRSTTRMVQVNVLVQDRDGGP
jgi:hypothetical protein